MVTVKAVLGILISTGVIGGIIKLLSTFSAKKLEQSMDESRESEKANDSFNTKALRLYNEIDQELGNSLMYESNSNFNVWHETLLRKCKEFDNLLQYVDKRVDVDKVEKLREIRELFMRYENAMTCVNCLQMENIQLNAAINNPTTSSPRFQELSMRRANNIDKIGNQDQLKETCKAKWREIRRNINI